MYVLMSLKGLSIYIVTVLVMILMYLMDVTNSSDLSINFQRYGYDSS